MSLSVGPNLDTGLVVVARYNEATDWSVSPWPVRIVQKDRDIVNAGREASSYAWFVATQPVDPDRTYAFVQGDPFPHGFAWNQLRTVDRYEPLGVHVLQEDRCGNPHHAGLRVEDSWAELDLLDPVPETIEFHAGAQFLVPGRVLLVRPRSWWADLARRVSDGGPLSPWVMERLWPYFLRSLVPG